MTLNKFITITSLIIAGEIIFALPFHLARFFRPTLLETFQLSATELGSIQGIYGIVAMLSYFPGGLLADRFPAHKLLATSLWVTALGGLYMASFPNYLETLILFSFFGITTIMLFWAALIRATRELGGLKSQGTTFGLLDGGRGLVAVSLASLGVLLFDYSFPHGYDSATLIEKQTTFKLIIYGYTTVTAITGIAVWFTLQNTNTKISSSNDKHLKSIIENLIRVMRFPAIWLQALIVLCAYTGYKSIDHLSLYAVDAYNFDAIEAAKLVTLGAWIRPLAAIFSGIIADYTHPIKILIISFVLWLLVSLYLALFTPQSDLTWILIINVLITCTAVFALRAVYFAVFNHYHLPIHSTGSAVGLISLVGFLPDIYVLYVAGKLIDTYPGIDGHQLFFSGLCVFAFIGLVSCIKLKAINQNIFSASR